MPLSPDYTNAAEVKDLLGITDTDDDAELALAISAASRMVDAFTRRQFGQAAAPAVRYYPIHGAVVYVDDFATAPASVAVEQGESLTTLGATEYKIGPRNAAAESVPYTYVRLARSYCGNDPHLAVQATYGWAAVPVVVEQATQIQAVRLFKRKDAAFGIAGSPEMGSEMRLLSKLDPDVEALLRPLRRNWGAV